MLSLKESFEWLVKRLKRRLPPQLIRQRKQGGETLDYIEWTTLCDILDDTTPWWSNYIKSVEIVGDRLVMIGGLELWDPETKQWVRRENVGIEDINTKSYGDVASNAFAMMLKRCGVLWGPGRELYKAPDYEPHKLATVEQVEKIIELIKSNVIPKEYHEATWQLLMSGTLTYRRAQAAIAKFTENGNGELTNDAPAEENVEQQPVEAIAEAASTNGAKSNGKKGSKKGKASK